VTSLRVVLEGSCLVDARRDGGIGRYARQLRTALDQIPALEVIVSAPARPPRSEARPSRFLYAQPHLLRTTRITGPHLVHGVGGEPVLGWAARRQVVTVHDVEMWRTAGPAGVRGAALGAYAGGIGRLLRRCAAVIAVSETTAAEATLTLGLDPSRVHVVPHGVSPSFDPPAKPADSAVLEAAGLMGLQYVLWVGSLRHHDPRKNLDILLEAMARLPAASRRLALAGATGPEAERLRSKGRALGVPVVLCGRRGDAELAALYRGAEVAVVPSGHEGFGFPVLEAMACGAPVVASTAGNIPAVAGQAALLVTPGNAVELAAAIDAVRRDPAVAGRLRRAGVRRAAEFSWDRCAELTAAVYCKVLSPPDRQ